MDLSVLSQDVIKVLQKHLYLRRNLEQRPIFIFSCGGNGNNQYARIL